MIVLFVSSVCIHREKCRHGIAEVSGFLAESSTFQTYYTLLPIFNGLKIWKKRYFNISFPYSLKSLTCCLMHAVIYWTAASATLLLFNALKYHSYFEIEGGKEEHMVYAFSAYTYSLSEASFVNPHESTHNRCSFLRLTSTALSFIHLCNGKHRNYFFRACCINNVTNSAD